MAGYIDTFYQLPMEGTLWVIELEQLLNLNNFSSTGIILDPKMSLGGWAQHRRQPPEDDI